MSLLFPPKAAPALAAASAARLDAMRQDEASEMRSLLALLAQAKACGMSVVTTGLSPATFVVELADGAMLDCDNLAEFGRLVDDIRSKQLGSSF